MKYSLQDAMSIKCPKFYGELNWGSTISKICWFRSLERNLNFSKVTTECEIAELAIGISSKMQIHHFSVSYGDSWGKKPCFVAYHVFGGTGMNRLSDFHI